MEWKINLFMFWKISSLWHHLNWLKWNTEELYSQPQKQNSMRAARLDFASILKDALKLKEKYFWLKQINYS